MSLSNVPQMTLNCLSQMSLSNVSLKCLSLTNVSLKCPSTTLNCLSQMSLNDPQTSFSNVNTVVGVLSKLSSEGVEQMSAL